MIALGPSGGTVGTGSLRSGHFPVLLEPRRSLKAEMKLFLDTYS